MNAGARIGRHAGLLVLALAAAGCATADYGAFAWSGSDESSLEAWLDQELEPYLAETLTTHPRFRRETVTVAVMRGDAPQAAPDSLSRALSLRLTRFLQSTPGVNLVWEGGRSAGDCVRREDAHYVVAVDLQQSGPGSHRLAIRALDREEGLWVTGFGKEWNGRLTRGQYARSRQPAVTGESRGLRDHPFREDEGDLLAERLASQLAADFCGFVGEPLVVHAEAAGQDAFVADTVQLVANNLARSPHIRSVRDPAAANLILSGRLYAIDGDLQQFWVQARPATAGARFPVTDVAAYVETSSPGRVALRSSPDATAAPAAADPLPAPPDRDPGFDSGRPVELGALRVLTPNDHWMCRRGDPWRRGARVLRPGESLGDDACFALEIEVSGDAEVFLLRRDPAAGLVRMIPGRCGRHGRVPGRTYGEATLRFPSAPAGWAHALRPPRAAMRERWIALALPADAAAADIRRHLARLPDDCAAEDGASVDADAWLAGLDRLTDAAVSVRRLDVPVGRHAARRE
ncbi:hypothetical protein [Lentisalinibacter salinarum]|uniref:hypothetical protein n=1 Tax=Lentisalinibacter salinarum TaxID=2992239 RepID=UPI0038658DB5